MTLQDVRRMAANVKDAHVRKMQEERARIANPGGKVRAAVMSGSTTLKTHTIQLATCHDAARCDVSSPGHVMRGRCTPCKTR
jgi:2-C-methyl-D-erythritol 4-phosphate cytidylyltransferase